MGCYEETKHALIEQLVNKLADVLRRQAMIIFQPPQRQPHTAPGDKLRQCIQQIRRLAGCVF